MTSCKSFEVQMSAEDMTARAEPLKLILIAAVTRQNGVGANGTLPWRLPKEMAHFRKATSSLAGAPHQESMNAVVMGRKTWQSIPPRFRPLKGRINVVVSRQSGEEALRSLEIDQAEDTFLVTSLDSAVELLRSQGAEKRLYRTFLIGGAQLWDEAVQKQQKGSGSPKWILDTLLITRIHEPAFEECDVFLPEFRTDEQARQDNDEPVAGLEETTSKSYIRSSPQDLDDFIGEAVEHGVVEEKDTRYSLQMWKKV